jgi:Pectate lyase superfamily protein
MTQYSRRGILKGAAASLFVSPAGGALHADAGALSRASWSFFHSGTNKSAAVFADSRLTKAHDNPVVADVSGLFPAIYLDPAVSYRAVLSTAAGAALQDVDPYNPARASENLVTVRMYGAVGDGVTDDTAAFEAAIYEARPELDRLRIHIPEGNYLLSRQIIPRRQVELVGAGMEVTRLIFRNLGSSNATMRGAIALGIGTTISAYTTNPRRYRVAPHNEYAAGGADFSRISDLSIFLEGKRPSDFHYGIWCAARATIERVHVQRGGFKFLGGDLTVGEGDLAGNANLCYVANCRSFYATEDGFSTDGGDANSIIFLGCRVWAPARIGYHEASAFGNTYIQCFRESVTPTTVNSYRSVSKGGINRSLFIGCYDEGDAMKGPHWNVGTPGLIMQSTGSIPETNLGPGFNTRLAASSLSGLVTHEMINVAADGGGYSIGSASSRASRLSHHGLYIRASDGSLFELIQAGGDAIYAQRDGRAVQKFVRGAAIADPKGGATVDVEARAAIREILERMRALTPTISS